jgi:hypothetical protein
MKLNYHKNLEHHLVKNGFQLHENTTYYFEKLHWKCYSIRKLKIFINKEFQQLRFSYNIRGNIFGLTLNGCKSLNDLYRLEKLIQGTTNQKSIK